jgi:hypothetical protein
MMCHTVCPEISFQPTPVPEDEAAQRALLVRIDARGRNNAEYLKNQRPYCFLTGLQMGWDGEIVMAGKLYRLHGLDTFEEYCAKVWHYKPHQVNKYRRILRAFGIERLQSEPAIAAGIERLALAATEDLPRPVQEVLFELACGRAACKRLKAGVKRALAAEAGVAAEVLAEQVRAAVAAAPAQAKSERQELEEARQQLAAERAQVAAERAALEKERAALVEQQRQAAEQRTRFMMMLLLLAQAGRPQEEAEDPPDARPVVQDTHLLDVLPPEAEEALAPFDPVAQALSRALVPRQNRALSGILRRLVEGADPRLYRPRLERLFDRCERLWWAPDRTQYQAWLDRLCSGPEEERRRFALHFLLHYEWRAQIPGQLPLLRHLRECPLPAALSREVESLWARACSGP